VHEGPLARRRRHPNHHVWHQPYRERKRRCCGVIVLDRDI
jgi:hypothetical protein